MILNLIFHECASCLFGDIFVLPCFIIFPQKSTLLNLLLVILQIYYYFGYEHFKFNFKLDTENVENITDVCLFKMTLSSIQLLSCVQLFATPWTAARQASPSITNSCSLLKPMSIDLVMPSSHLIICRPLSSCPQSFSASGSFPVSQFFTSGGQSIGGSASASVLTMNIQE